MEQGKEGNRVVSEPKNSEATWEFVHRMDTLALEKLTSEVERLKAEKDQAECDYDNCQRRKVSIDNHRFDLFTENKNLKAEVERLHKYVETMERESMSDEYEINNQTRIINGLLTEKEQLKAENERLRKAGDEMADEYRRMCKNEPASGWFHRLMAGNEEFTIEHLEAWNAAKEGKPSV